MRFILFPALKQRPSTKKQILIIYQLTYNKNASRKQKLPKLSFWIVNIMHPPPLFCSWTLFRFYHCIISIYCGWGRVLFVLFFCLIDLDQRSLKIPGMNSPAYAGLSWPLKPGNSSQTLIYFVPIWYQKPFLVGWVRTQHKELEWSAYKKGGTFLFFIFAPEEQEMLSLVCYNQRTSERPL